MKIPLILVLGMITAAGAAKSGWGKAGDVLRNCLSFVHLDLTISIGSGSGKITPINMKPNLTAFEFDPGLRDLLARKNLSQFQLQRILSQLEGWEKPGVPWDPSLLDPKTGLSLLYPWTKSLGEPFFDKFSPFKLDQAPKANVTAQDNVMVDGVNSPFDNTPGANLIVGLPDNSIILTDSLSYRGIVHTSTDLIPLSTPNLEAVVAMVIAARQKFNERMMGIDPEKKLSPEPGINLPSGQDKEKNNAPADTTHS